MVAPGFKKLVVQSHLSMSGTTSVWFRCLCSNSRRSLEDKCEYYALLKGDGAWPRELSGTCYNCDRSFVARHIHRETDLLLKEEAGRTSELGEYSARLRNSQEIVGFVTGIYNTDGDEGE